MTATMYRRFSRLDDQMVRAAMPRTSAADPVVPIVRRPVVPGHVRWTLGRRYETKGSFTLAEVVHA